MKLKQLANMFMHFSCFLHCILHEKKLEIVNVKDSLGALQFQMHEANTYLSHYCHQIKVSPWMARACNS